MGLSPGAQLAVDLAGLGVMGAFAPAWMRWPLAITAAAKVGAHVLAPGAPAPGAPGGAPYAAAGGGAGGGPTPARPLAGLGVDPRRAARYGGGRRY